MAIEKTNRINALFEFYEPLLTKKQMNYIALYYRDDFSLGEIAENYEVSRQAVYDNIKRKNMSRNCICIVIFYNKAKKRMNF